MINPLKLKCTEQAYKLTLGDMAKKVDELVKAHNSLLESLQAKEEAEQQVRPDIYGYPESNKKRKQHSCEFYKCTCILDPKTGTCISKAWHVCNHINPPEHEESRGECKHDWHPSGEYCVKCGVIYKEFTKDKVYLVDERNFEFKAESKEESPKEDEEELLNQVHDIILCQVGNTLSYKEAYDEVAKIINKVFVSKEKIKRVAKELLWSNTQANGFHVVKKYHLDLIKSLGLGD